MEMKTRPLNPIESREWINLSTVFQHFRAETKVNTHQTEFPSVTTPLFGLVILPFPN